MTVDPRMQPLMDVIVDLVVADIVREFEMKNAVGLGGQHDGVEEMRSDDCQATRAHAQDVRAHLQDL